MAPTTRTAIRRRRAAFGLVALVALLCGLVVGAGAGDEPSTPASANHPSTAGSTSSGSGGTEPSAEDVVAEMTLREQVGQTVLLRFEGAAVPTYVADALRAREAAGVVLFGDNVVSSSQVRDLTRRLQRAAGDSALVSADQEGGAIRILPFAASSSGQSAQDTASRARTAARRTARDLRAVGLNMNLAPVADVGAGEGSPLGDRSFPGDSDAVASLVEAAVAAYREARVAATAKHFPGLGGATANTDDAPATIRTGREELEQSDLEPFRAAIGAGVPIVMVGHARYPAFDRDNIASQSNTVIEGLLRQELGFDGVVVTDSLEAEASLDASSGSVPLGAIRALEAGADLALTTDDASYAPVFERLLDRARRSPEFRARIERSAGRVLELKRRLGLRGPSAG